MISFRPAAVFKCIKHAIISLYLLTLCCFRQQNPKMKHTLCMCARRRPPVMANKMKGQQWRMRQHLISSINPI